MLAAEPVVVRSSKLSSELINRLSNARRRSDALFDVVRTESLYERPIPERHRIIFYIGHLEAFDWNLLNGSVFGLNAVNPDFDRLFAFGIDPVGGGLPTDRPSDWPSLERVRNYVNGIRGAIDHHLQKAILEPEAQTRDDFPLRTLLNVAIEHRLMHAETLAYMLHQLPFTMKVPQETSPDPNRSPVTHRIVSVPAGTATLGLRRASQDFGWDNEYESHTIEVPAFEIDQYKVTNRQYLEFMAAGGYETRGFWNDDDWNWKTTNGISHPAFWKRLENRSSSDRVDVGKGLWLCRNMFNEVPLMLDWPVYVSHAEAKAYARWAGKSLPNEAEWQRAAYGTVDGNERKYPWGSEPADATRGNFDFHRWDPAPVNAFPGGESAFGAQDMLGNGWEWTSTVFGPFQGFEPFPFYRGYSADFFDGKHFVMKGGSARTAASMLRSTFRNWFQSHYQYAYSGFRCVSR